MSFDTFADVPLDQSIASAVWNSGDVSWLSQTWLVGDGAGSLKASATIPGGILGNYNPLAGHVGQALFFKPKAGRDGTVFVAAVIIDAAGAASEFTSNACVRASVGAYGQLAIRDIAAGVEQTASCALTDGNEYCLELQKTTDASGKQYRATVYNASGGVRGSQIQTVVITVATALTGRLVQMAMGYQNRTYITVTRVESIDGAPPAATTINLVGASTSQANTSSTGAAGVNGAAPAGTVTSDIVRGYDGLAKANFTIPNVVLLKLDRTVALSLANQVTNGAGRLVISNAALVAGTDYMLATFSADGLARGLKKVTAS